MATAETAPDILSAEYRRDPYPLHRVLRDRFPVAWHEGTHSYLISRHEDVRRAFRDPVFSSKNYEWQLEPVQGRAVHQMEGHEHSAHRKVLNPVLRGPGLQALRPTIERNARRLVSGWRDDGEVELVSAFTTHFPVSVMLSLFDLPEADHHLFEDWYAAWMGFLSNLAGDPELEANGFRARDEFRAYVAPLVAERRRRPGSDLLSHLCTAELEPGVGLSDETVVSFCGNLITAGGATTDKAIASLMRNLVADPAQMRAVRSDRSLVANAFAETLRHSSPVQMVMRTTLEDVEVAGRAIPADALVTCVIAAANRDDRVFAEPDRFDVLRGDLAFERAFSGAADHLGFCWGRHFCAGSLLARAEVEIGVGMLLDVMDDIAFADGRPPAEDGVFTRAPAALPLRFTPAGGAA